LNGWPDPAPAVEPPPPSGPVYAGFWRRFAAALLDGLVMLTVAVVLQVTGLMPSGSPAAEAVANLLSTVPAWLYYAGLHASPWQATLGKRALGIKVTDHGGARIGFRRATARYLASVLSALSLFAGYLAAAVTVDRRALHDVMAGTRVLHRAAGPAELAAAPQGKRWPAWAFVLIVLGVVVAVSWAATLRDLRETPGLVQGQLAEALAEVEGYKDRVEAAVADGTPLGSTRTEQPASEHVGSVMVTSDGRIVLVFADTAESMLAGRRLELLPARSAGSRRIAWVCGYAPVPSGFAIPEGGGERVTDVPESLLPAHCQSGRR
jgi:uncharacterized RDD family membrane protein YckC